MGPDPGPWPLHGSRALDPPKSQGPGSGLDTDDVFVECALLSECLEALDALEVFLAGMDALVLDEGGASVAYG